MIDRKASQQQQTIDILNNRKPQKPLAEDIQQQRIVLSHGTQRRKDLE